MISVDVDTTYDDSGEEILAKFSDENWEVNVRARASEFLTLSDIRSFDWNERRATKVGRCAGTNVFWCSDGKTATIMLGHDDETWDVAFSLPVEVIDDLVRQVRSPTA
ncbi:hypothetical protein [Nocardioides rubriscoriae]|uniref:hypothetical protein n=1 Tax=Nocardioides rubriscoriae TaxID=642762 RepID=UPI0011DF6646|nr:hypothetical protein [Nocardioides rubriscoriae]